MSNLEDQQILEVENKYWVEQWEALKSLKEDKRFQKVILEGYFKDKAINGVSLLAQDYIVENGHRTKVMEDLIGVSSLEDHFMTIESLGSTPAELDDEDEDNNV